VIERSRQMASEYIAKSLRKNVESEIRKNFTQSQTENFFEHQTKNKWNKNRIFCFFSCLNKIFYLFCLNFLFFSLLSELSIVSVWIFCFFSSVSRFLWTRSHQQHFVRKHFPFAGSDFEEAPVRVQLAMLIANGRIFFCALSCAAFTLICHSQWDDIRTIVNAFDVFESAHIVMGAPDAVAQWLTLNWTLIFLAAGASVSHGQIAIVFSHWCALSKIEIAHIQVRDAIRVAQGPGRCPYTGRLHYTALTLISDL